MAVRADGALRQRLCGDAATLRCWRRAAVDRNLREHRGGCGGFGCRSLRRGWNAPPLCPSTWGRDAEARSASNCGLVTDTDDYKMAKVGGSGEARKRRAELDGIARNPLHGPDAALDPVWVDRGGRDCGLPEVNLLGSEDLSGESS